MRAVEPSERLFRYKKGKKLQQCRVLTLHVIVGESEEFRVLGNIIVKVIYPQGFNHEIRGVFT